jgi:hypothetical protein
MPQRIEQDYFEESDVTEFTLKKNYSGIFIKSAAVFKSLVQTNSLGWRDTEPDSREKILVFGDSFIFGYGLNNGETIPDRLEQFSNKKKDFVNLGYAAGRSPDSYANYIKFHPELKNLRVIIVLLVNDLQDVLNNEYLDSKGNLLENFSELVSKIKNKIIILREGMIFLNSLKNRYTPIPVIKLLRQSYIVAIIRASLSRIMKDLTNAEIAAVKLANTPNRKGMERILTSIKYIEKNSKDTLIITMSRRNQGNNKNQFFREITKFCKDYDIKYSHVRGFGPGFFWIRDGHYNQSGALEAAKIIFKSLPDDWLQEDF